MISEIIGLTQILMSLVGKKAELDRNYFEQFIQPAWEAFEKVHEDYKASFERYTQLISEENPDLELIVEQINKDSIYTSDLRSEAQKLVKYLPSAKLKTKEEYLLNFVKAIEAYFGDEHTSHIRRVGLHLKNLARVQAVFALQDHLIPLSVSNQFKSSTGDIGRIFAHIVNELQHKYDVVADAYYRLRAELLV